MKQAERRSAHTQGIEINTNLLHVIFLDGSHIDLISSNSDRDLKGRRASAGTTGLVGPRILRTPRAAVVAFAIMRTIGDLNSTPGRIDSTVASSRLNPQPRMRSPAVERSHRESCSGPLHRLSVLLDCVLSLMNPPWSLCDPADLTTDWSSQRE